MFRVRIRTRQVSPEDLGGRLHKLQVFVLLQGRVLVHKEDAPALGECAAGTQLPGRRRLESTQVMH